MDLGTVIWALLTGGITVGAWVGIALLARQSRLANRQAEELMQVGAHLREVDGRLAELEERVDFTERLLTRQDEAERRLPPAGA